MIKKEKIIEKIEELNKTITVLEAEEQQIVQHINEKVNKINQGLEQLVQEGQVAQNKIRTGIVSRQGAVTELKTLLPEEDLKKLENKKNKQKNVSTVKPRKQ